MKKTIIVLLALSSMAMAGDSDLLQPASYKWTDFSADPLGGQWRENATPMTPSTEKVTIAGTEATALTSYLEGRGGSTFFKDSIVAAATNDTASFTITFDYLYKAANTSWGQAIFHVGAKGQGISIASSGTGLVSVFTGNAGNDADYVTKAEAAGVSTSMKINEWNTIAITFGNDYQTDIFVNGEKVGSTTLSNISWGGEANNYCFGEVAPGWQSSGQKPFNDSQARLANFTATFVPEPATATLSLLALAGLASRRRRH